MGASCQEAPKRVSNTSKSRNASTCGQGVGGGGGREGEYDHRIEGSWENRAYKGVQEFRSCTIATLLWLQFMYQCATVACKKCLGNNWFYNDSEIPACKKTKKSVMGCSIVVSPSYPPLPTERHRPFCSLLGPTYVGDGVVVAGVWRLTFRECVLALPVLRKGKNVKESMLPG